MVPFRLPRRARMPTRGILAASGSAGVFNVEITPSPSQGGGVILSAFAGTGIGLSEMASNSGDTSSVTTTGATSQASGSTFVIDILCQYSANISVSDSKGNNYGSPHIQAANYAGAFDLVRFVCLNGTGGASHAATCSNSAGNTEITMFFTEITSCAAMAGDSVSAVDGSSPITSPALTVTAPSGVLLAVCSGDSFSSNHSFSGSGYTGLELEPATDGNHAQGATMYRTVP